MTEVSEENKKGNTAISAEYNPIFVKFYFYIYVWLYV